MLSGGVAPGVVSGGQQKINPTNLLQLYLMFQGRRDRNAADELARQKQARDKLWDDTKETKIAEPWDSFNSRIRERKNAVLQVATDAIYNKEVPLDRLRSALPNMWKPVQDYADEVSVWKNSYLKALELIDKGDEGKFYNKDARGAINDVFFHPDGSPKDDTEIRSTYKEGLNNVWDNPKYLNKNAVLDNFVGGLDTNVQEYLMKIPHAEGEALTQSEISSQLPYKTKEVIEGGFKKKTWDLDERGERQLIMTPTLFKMANDDPKLHAMMVAEAGDDVQAQKDWLTKNLPNFDKASIKQTPTISKTSPEDRLRFGFGIDFGSGNKVPPIDIMNRFREQEDIATSYRPEKLDRYVDKSKGEDAYYLDKAGNKIVNYYVDKEGRRNFVNDKGGVSHDQPTSIVMEKLDPLKAQVNAMETFRIMNNSSLTPEQRTAELQKLHHNYFKVEFNKLDTKEGRFKFHTEGSDILDLKYTKSQAFKEGYDKVMQAKYPTEYPTTNSDERKKKTKLDLNADNWIKK